jgi:hypothetical protein
MMGNLLEVTERICSIRKWLIVELELEFKEGEMPSINVTITEEVPPELLAKMSKFCCYLSIHLIRNYGN